MPDITAPPAKPTTAAATANGQASSAPLADDAVDVNMDEVEQEPTAEASIAPAVNNSKATAAMKEQPKKTESCLSQSVAVIGISLVAMGEDIGSAMALRLFGQLVGYII